MADISKITIPLGTYDIKDSSALTTLSISDNTIIGTTRGGATVSVTVPDTKVTSVNNHYTPTASVTLSADGATGTIGANLQVVTGIRIDAKGHITSVISGQTTDTVKEAYLQWGGKNISGDYAPIDAALNPVLSPNRLAGINPDGVYIEYSNDGGTTWEEYKINGNSLTNAQKTSLFTTSQSIRIGGYGTTINATSQVRITIDGVDGGIYTRLNKMHIYLSTSYSSGCKVSMESYDYNSSTTWHQIITDQAVSGWSGWNVLNFDLPGTKSFGGTNSNTHQRKIRLTFTHTGITSGKETSGGLTISKIYAYGGVGWTTNSTMASNGVPYTYDYAGVANFPYGLKSKGTTVSVEGHTHSGYANSSHTHGNISNAGAIISSVSIAANDALIIADNSNSNILEKTSIVFDGTTTNKYLSPKGTWESTPTISVTTSGSGNVVTNITSSNHTITVTKGNVEIPTLTLSATGSGNALTSMSVSGHTINVSLGATFATSGHNHDSDYAAKSHSHGSITSTGSISASVSIANNDRLIIRDSDGTIKSTTLVFNGTTTTSFLSQKGTWETISASPTDSSIGDWGEIGYK